MAPEESLKELFQQEFSRMVAVISRSFGLEHIELAEDIVSETFLLAAETWGVRGLPPNPPAWLYKVAKQKASYHFRRKKIFDRKVAPAVKAQQSQGAGPTGFADSELLGFAAGPLDFSPRNIRDSQLQMLFAVCDPAIASEAQIGLALRVLCGFGIDAIADAFLTNKEAINKRLFRAKEKLRAEKVRMELPPDGALPGRLDNVLRIIYLLFSEGYYSRSEDRILRKELCVEAMRLGLLLADYPVMALPRTHALIALMCFHASRFDARQTEDAALVLYDQQDPTRWDQGLIAQGMYYLDLSAQGEELSTYHPEAMIAYWHCIKTDSEEKWRAILDCYDRLLEINYSSSVALNRLYALYKVKGRAIALAETEALKLEGDHFYFLLLGELNAGIDDGKAKMNYQRAYELARTTTEKLGIQEKIAALMERV